MGTNHSYDPLSYMHGFGNEFQSEAPGFEGCLPDIVNPQRLKHNLKAEQLSGSAFTAPRASNKRSWLYRKRPAVCQTSFRSHLSDLTNQFKDARTVPDQTRWYPFKDEEISSVNRKSFIEGLHLLAFNNADGCASSSIAIYIYMFNDAMIDSAFINADGDFLLVPQEGDLAVRTEFGRMLVKPEEICVIQQGMAFSIDEQQSGVTKRGYILEIRGNHFELPYLGPIGANCLANPRDFLVPTAYVEADDRPYQMCYKFQNEFFLADRKHSPYDVAAWFGNYTPYKYDLSKFVSVNSVSVDHPDPSIFTVLTCPSIGKPGTALADFVIFPPRWECAGKTFRPPYYHRNCMTEFMGLIKGQYQAKGEKFAPGGASLHQSMIPHGPDLECYKNASSQDTSEPKRVADNTMAFMFESSLALKLTGWAVNQRIDSNYQACWDGLNDLEM